MKSFDRWNYDLTKSLKWEEPHKKVDEIKIDPLPVEMVDTKINTFAAPSNKNKSPFDPTEEFKRRNNEEIIKALTIWEHCLIDVRIDLMEEIHSTGTKQEESQIAKYLRCMEKELDCRIGEAIGMLMRWVPPDDIKKSLDEIRNHRHHEYIEALERQNYL